MPKGQLLRQALGRHYSLKAAVCEVATALGRSYDSVAATVERLRLADKITRRRALGLSPGDELPEER